MYLLIVIIFISASLYIYSDFIKNQTLKYIFKPLTTILIIILAIIHHSESTNLYGYLIITGLVFSLIGDVYLMLPIDKFIHGLAAFLIAHIFYIVAFCSGFGPYFEVGYLIPAVRRGRINSSSEVILMIDLKRRSPVVFPEKAKQVEVGKS